MAIFVTPQGTFKKTGLGLSLPLSAYTPVTNPFLSSQEDTPGAKVALSQSLHLANLFGYPAWLPGRESTAFGGWAKVPMPPMLPCSSLEWPQKEGREGGRLSWGGDRKPTKSACRESHI